MGRDAGQDWTACFSFSSGALPASRPSGITHPKSFGLLLSLFHSSRVAARCSATSEAWADSGSPVAVFAACAAAAERVFAPIAGSVVGASAPSAAFSLHWLAVVPSAGGPAPVSAGVSGGPVAASHTAFPAVVGTSGRVSRFPCSEQQGVDGV